jgi:hypothetical protein
MTDPTDSHDDPFKRYRNYRIQDMYEKAKVSVQWLKDNYSHIWWHPDIGYRQKAGFLAACCDSHRCYLATLNLSERIHYIEHALIQTGVP